MPAWLCFLFWSFFRPDLPSVFVDEPQRWGIDERRSLRNLKCSGMYGESEKRTSQRPHINFAKIIRIM